MSLFLAIALLTISEAVRVCALFPLDVGVVVGTCITGSIGEGEG